MGARRRDAKEYNRSPRNTSRRGGGGNRRRSLVLSDLIENAVACDDDGEQQDHQSVLSMMDGSLLSLMNESVITMGSRSLHKSRHNHSSGGALSAFLNHDVSRADQEFDDEDESMMLE